jgi:hypothetical protein
MIAFIAFIACVVWFAHETVPKSGMPGFWVTLWESIFALPWKGIGIGLLVLVLVIAWATVTMRNPVAGRTIFALLILYAILRRGRLVRWWRTNADHQPLRTVRRIGMFYVFWGLLWGLLSPWTGLGSPWTVVPVFAVLIVITALKSRQMLRWWRAWDERGRPIDIEVLPDAKVTRP